MIQIIDGKPYKLEEVQEAPLRTEQYSLNTEIARLQVEKAEKVAEYDSKITALQTQLKVTEDVLVEAGFPIEVVDVVEEVIE